MNVTANNVIRKKATGGEIVMLVFACILLAAAFFFVFLPILFILNIDIDPSNEQIPGATGVVAAMTYAAIHIWSWANAFACSAIGAILSAVLAFRRKDAPSPLRIGALVLLAIYALLLILALALNGFLL